MKKHFFTGLITGLIIVAICTAVVLANAGSEGDPLISKSYLETVYLDTVKTEMSFKVVSLKAGQRIVGDAGCEMILRMGKATIFSTDKGGVSDVTIGGDHPHGSEMPANHLLIVPVGDGRGITADTDALVMVKGKYALK
ncbi:MAG: hypothetical protein IKT39_06290 [Clostridia bacterium]|nr:hypothetical protein [Clostridia bacterium]